MLEVHECEDGTYYTINSLGTKCWYNKEGKVHKEDGPAIIYTNGLKDWYLNGKIQKVECVDGKVIVYNSDGLSSKHYDKDGKYLGQFPGYKQGLKDILYEEYPYPSRIKEYLAKHNKHAIDLEISDWYYYNQ